MDNTLKNAVSIHEICKETNFPYNTLLRWSKTNTDFPKPITTIIRTKLYDKRELLLYIGEPLLEW